MKPFHVLAAGALLFFAGSPSAQTLFVLDGPAAVVRELSGPPDPLFCSYPDGPIQSQFPTPGPFPCPLPVPLPPPPELRGDLTVNRPKDTVWVTDGTRIAEYNALGVAINSFQPPPGLLVGPVLGLGFNGAAGTLWVTDGQRAVELSPPATPCTTPPVVSGPFTLPPIGGVLSPVTDIDWSPASNTLWVCTAQGNVGNLIPGGAVLSSFSAVPGPCALQAPLLGLAVDTAVSGSGALFLTDGVRVARVGLTGSPAPATFGQPQSCFTVPVGNAYGLGFSSRGIYYGQGGPVGGMELGSFGQAVVPSTSLGVTLAGAPPSSVAILPFTLKPLCPAIVYIGMPILIEPPSFALFTRAVTTSGDSSISIAIPPSAPVGLEIFYQWFVVGFGPSPVAEGSPLLSSGAGSMRTGFH